MLDMEGTIFSLQEPTPGIRASPTISVKTVCGRSVLTLKVSGGYCREVSEGELVVLVDTWIGCTSQ